MLSLVCSIYIYIKWYFIPQSIKLKINKNHLFSYQILPVIQYITEIHYGPVTSSWVPTTCSWRCIIHGNIRRTARIQKNVLFNLKCLQVKMSWRSDGDRGYSTELLRVLFGDLKISEYPPSANDVLRLFTPVQGVLSALSVCTRRSVLIGMFYTLYNCTKKPKNFKLYNL